MTRRIPFVLVLSITLLLLAVPAVQAHPLGNFTTNTSAAVLPAEGSTEILYVLDLAEIPTQQTRSAITAAGGEDAWAQEECTRVAEVQSLTVDGSAVGVTAEAAAIAFPEGEAGLDLLRLTCGLEAVTEGLADPVEMAYADGYVSGRVGWREVIAIGDGSTILESDVPEVSETEQLRVYPDAEVSTVTTATLLVDPTEGAEAPASLRSDDLQPVEVASGLGGLVQSYTDMVSRQTLTVPFVLLAVVLSILLGTAHAVAPGHGKTVIAAYLLGEGGQARQAVALGGTVAITHTIGVLLLGLIVQTSTTLAPESLYPFLGVMGGVLFTILGVILLRRALTDGGHGHSHDEDGGRGHSHGRDHGHGHAVVPVVPVAAGHVHGDHARADEELAAHERAEHDHGHDHGDHGHVHAPARSQSPGWRMLVLPGLAGGMVPSPSALVVLLGGIALDRTWFGILLVLFYGVGMALALVGAGYLLHRVRFRLIDRLEGPTWTRVSGVLPVATSALIVVGGVVIVARSILTA